MQQLGGLLLMLSGAAALGGYLYLPPPPDGEQDVAEVTRISVAPYHKMRAPDISTRTFSPASSAFRQVVTIEGRPSSAAAQAPMPGAWTTVVTAETSSAAVLRSPKPTDAGTRYQLARDLQRGLQRAGCYGGEINGAWTVSTRRAMAAFMDRANATLPSDKPDYILLSLVQSHDDISCRAECPARQVMDQDGRCVPQAVIAQASKRSKRLEERRLAESRLTAPQTRTAAATPEKLPWLDSNGRSLVAQAEPRATPPAGMMSIGGPGAGIPLPPERPAPMTSNWRAVPIENSDGTQPGASGPNATGTSNANAAEPKMAALAPEDMAPADAANIDPSVLPSTMERPEKHRRARGNSRRGWDERPRHYSSGYGSRGRGRRGDPRPGTMRYNLVQSLGGIY